MTLTTTEAHASSISRLTKTANQNKYVNDGTRHQYALYHSCIYIFRIVRGEEGATDIKQPVILCRDDTGTHYSDEYFQSVILQHIAVSNSTRDSVVQTLL